ncbi:MAG: FAD-dependent oxidoreductase [Candidatus Wallbacteria bacterium]
MAKKPVVEEVCVKKHFDLGDAMREADRCLMCHDAPCSTGCPAGTNPGKFVRQLKLKNIKGAARTVRSNNILGGISAEVCPTCTLCVQKCSRTGIDRPIEINKIQQFLADYQNEMNVEVFDKPKPLGKKIAVIGSGPSGLACAAKLALFGYDVTIFEKNDTPGGVLAHGIPYYRLRRRTLKNDIEAVTKLGVKIKCGTEINDKTSIKKLLKDGFAAVYIAAGLSKPNFIKMPGSDLKGVFEWSQFLNTANDEKTRKDAEKLVKGKNVVVIGGGSVAMDAAVTAKMLGAEKTYAVSLEALDELPADHEEIELGHQYNVIFKPSTQITKISGKSGKVTGVCGNEIEWVKPLKFTPDNAKAVAGTDFSLNADVVIFAVGSRVNDDITAAIENAGVAAAKNRLVTVDKDYKTNVKNVYAGGDIVNGGKTVTYAIYDGKKAAETIHKNLSKGAGK